MKNYSVIVIIFLLAQNCALAKLRNGYEKDIHYVRESLKNYNDILNTNKDLPSSDRRKMKARINELIIYQSHYELTEELLNQFKHISPDLYYRIDSIRDAKGRFTDVYVKFIPREEELVMATGITRMAQSDEDEDACVSEYGNHSVSIKIWICSKALLVLSHELGHVNYQVPNFDTYLKYYKMEYSPVDKNSNCVGHSAADRSGRSATIFEREFKKNYVNNLKLGKGNARLESPLVLMEEIKRKIKMPVLM